jgi:hypothetical protein
LTVSGSQISSPTSGQGIGEPRHSVRQIAQLDRELQAEVAEVLKAATDVG